MADPTSTARAVVTAKRNRRARQMPLFEHAGIADAVEPLPTVEDVLAKRARAQEIARRCQAARCVYEQRHIAHWRAVYEELIGPVPPLPPHIAERPGYWVNHWSNEIADTLGVPRMELHARYRLPSPTNQEILDGNY
jgi:hypothetical protein